MEQMARDCKCSVADLFASAEIRKSIDLKRYISDEVGEPTLRDILRELEAPGRDPRTDSQDIAFDDSIESIDDLREGMELNGIVSNITQFGAFVDIGVHISGLVHISEISDRFVRSASEAVKLNQAVRVRVKAIDYDRKRIALSMKGVKQ